MTGFNVYNTVHAWFNKEDHIYYTHLHQVTYIQDSPICLKHNLH